VNHSRFARSPTASAYRRFRGSECSRSGNRPPLTSRPPRDPAGRVLHGVLDEAGIDYDEFAAWQARRQERPGAGPNVVAHAEPEL